MAQQDRDRPVQEEQGDRPKSESEEMRLAGREQSPDQPDAQGTHGDSAVGRENPAASPVDADEAMGNRVGGYGADTGEGISLLEDE